MRFQALADFKVHYPNPMKLSTGDPVRIAQRDRMWPEWIWTTDRDGKSGWVHESQLTIPVDGSGSATASEDSDAREISLTKGEIVESLRELGGWHWCRKSSGEEGWTPGYNLRTLPRV